MPGRDRYQDEHRIFLQGMMCQGILKEKEVYALHNKALKMCDISIPETKGDQNSLLANNIQTINKELRKVGLLIKKGQDEDSGKSFFLLVNTQSRMIGSNRELASSVQVITSCRVCSNNNLYLKTQWSSQELEYLRLIATEILESEIKEISSTEALRLTDQVVKKAGKKLSMEAAEKTITNLIRAMWLKESMGKFVLGVRFIGEMESWMVEVMGPENLQHCQACRKIVVRGGFCSSHPDVVWHIYCLEKSARLKADIKCGFCHKKVTVGGRARPTRDKEENEKEEVSQRPRKQAGRGGRRSQAEEHEEVENEEISPRPGPSRGEPSKRFRRGSDKSSRMEVEEEEPSQAGGGRIERRPSGESDSD